MCGFAKMGGIFVQLNMARQKQSMMASDHQKNGGFLSMSLLTQVSVFFCKTEMG